MKFFKKSLLLLMALFAIGFLFINASNVKADGEAVITMTAGAAIRTREPAGLKFSAEISGDFGEGTIYGFAFVRGEKTRSEMISRFESDNTGNVEVSPVEGVISASVVNIPVEAFANDITALAYAIDGGINIYASTVVTRNIYEIAKAAYDGGLTNDFIEGILGEYHEVIYHYNGPLINYESLGEMEADFIADFNATTGRSLASASEFYSKAGTGPQTFFNNPEMNAKWIWLVDQLELLRQQGYGNHSICTTAYAHAKSMTLDATLNDNIPFRQNIQGYFTRTKTTNYSSAAAIDFTNFVVRDQMFTTMTKTVITRNNSSLIDGVTRFGYNFAGWYLDSACTSLAVDVGENITDLYAKWTLNDYDITYYDGSTLLNLSPSSYNMLSSTFDLPDYVKGGYVFNGWYDNPSFDGDSITQIEIGSIGNKTFYAKTTQSENVAVNVILDPNGGLLPKEYVSDTPTRTISVTTYDNSGNAEGTYLCSTAVTSSNSLRWQYKILLQYNATIDAYLVVATDAAKKSANAVASDAGVTWTHALSNSSINISTYATVGQYIILSVDSLSIGMDAFSAYVHNATSFTSFSSIYTLSTPLPVPYREGYTFTGWLNSQTGLVEDTFPGYLINPGDITYTGEWEAN